MLEIRPINLKEDYKTISSWWNVPVPLGALPTTGILVHSGDEYIAAGFLFMTNSSLGLIEFLVSNPSADSEIRSEAFDILVNSLVGVARDAACTAVLCSARPHLVKRFNNHGFRSEPEPAVMLVKHFGEAALAQ